MYPTDGLPERVTLDWDLWHDRLHLEDPHAADLRRPLTMADDLTVLNVTKDHIEVREVTLNQEVWPQGSSKAWDTAPRGEPATGLSSKWLTEGALEGMIPPPSQPMD